MESRLNPPPFRADLHTHTTFSDGTLTPAELIDLALQYGLQGLSITDHDTAAAYETARPFAKQKGIALLTGAEFSADYAGESVHILAYAFAHDSEIIETFSKKHLERRSRRNLAILKLLQSNGLKIDPEDFEVDFFSQTRPIGRPHIAQVMVKKGYVDSIQKAFHLYLGEGKPCFVYGGAFSVEETLAVIHKAKGLAVIAHPHLIKKRKIFQNLLKMPFDGIEGYYAAFPKNKQERFVRVGKEKKWLITGGSDFHGSIKPSNPLGSSWVDKETFDYLINHQLLNT